MESWLEQLIGIPYVDYGNTPAEGFHCTGLVRYILKTKFNKDFPDDPLKWRAELNDLGWPVKIRSYDIVVMRNENDEPHIGIAVGDSDVLHAWRSAGGVVLQRVESLQAVITTIARLR